MIWLDSFRYHSFSLLMYPFVNITWLYLNLLVCVFSISLREEWGLIDRGYSQSVSLNV